VYEKAKEEDEKIRKKKEARLEEIRLES